MSTEAFEDFYFDVCNLDYARLARALRPLVERMDAAREVHITGPETDLRFSIEGIPVVPCAGEMNIPDGEVFTAPVRDSVEGHVRFNTPDDLPGHARSTASGSSSAKGRIVAADCAGGDVEEAPADPRDRRGRPLHRRVVDRLQSRASCTRCATSSSTRRSPAAST